MPVGFLTDSQTREYGCFVGDPTPDQLARHFHLDDADRLFVAMHRGDHNRLGVAVQLGSLRMLGTFLEDPRQAPASVVRFAANQLSISSAARLMTTYAQSAGRWRHGPRIRERYGYRTYTDFGVAFRLHRFLYALCWTGTDRPSAVFDRAVAWLLEAKVLLPGLSVLERAVARVRILSCSGTRSIWTPPSISSWPKAMTSNPKTSIGCRLSGSNISTCLADTLSLSPISSLEGNSGRCAIQRTPTAMMYENLM